MRDNEVDELFKNEIFKDHLDNRIEKWIKGLHINDLKEKVKTLDLEKKLKIDYMLKMNQLERNDKSHQAIHDKVFKEITELQTEFADMKQAHDTWWEDLASIVTYEVPKLKEQIAEFKEWMGERRKRIEKAFEMIEKNSIQSTFIQQKHFNLEEVLWDHIDQHWKIADADRDNLSIIHSWKGKLILQLEKLKK